MSQKHSSTFSDCFCGGIKSVQNNLNYASQPQPMSRPTQGSEGVFNVFFFHGCWQWEHLRVNDITAQSSEWNGVWVLELATHKILFTKAAWLYFQPLLCRTVLIKMTVCPSSFSTIFVSTENGKTIQTSIRRDHTTWNALGDGGGINRAPEEETTLKICLVACFGLIYQHNDGLRD